MPKLINVPIIVSHVNVGEGVEGDPIRNVEEWYTPDGQIILSYDSIKKETLYVGFLIEYLRKIAN